MTSLTKYTSCLVRALVWSCLLLITGVFTAQAQTTISDIVGNPGRYNDEVVSIEGTVSRHVDTGDSDDATSSTKNYILEDNNGAEIRAKTTSEPPETGTRYQVEGLISISPFNRQPVLVEQSRSEISDQQQATSSDQLRQGFSTITVYLIFGLGILVIVVLAYFAYASRQGEGWSPTGSTATEEPEGAGAVDRDSSFSPSSQTIGGDGEEAEAEVPEPAQQIKSESSSSFKPEAQSGGPETLKFKAPPKTMKFVPGRLVVAAGPDQGKEFRIAGHPTPEGNVVTIGRAKVEGERAFAHIQLGDTYRTVSRMQAEIIQQDQTILLKNKSETNPTMVNGDQLPTEETMELTDGDMIRMGELMLRYERD